MVPHQHLFKRIRSLIVLFPLLYSRNVAQAASEQWQRVSSDHFIVLTDAGERKGHEVAARFEQMRNLFGQLLMRRKLRMSEPLEIIAVGSDKEYAQVAPLVNGQPTKAPAFFLAGEDRIFVVLNLFEPDSWRAIQHQMAHYLLNYNYPQTQPWFDEGFAEYFSSLYLRNKGVELGSDPELSPAYQTDLLGNETEARTQRSFTEMLSNPVWLSWPDLFTMKNRSANGQEGTHQTLFYAQSWILVHYLLNKNKLGETGTYFDLVENQRVPAEPALQQAFGMSAAQLDREVKEYFHSLTPLFDALDASKRPSAVWTPQPVYQLPLPFTVDEVATSAKSVPQRESQALIEEMDLRIPERRQTAFEQLEKLAADEKTDTVIAHRALAWEYVRRGETNKAFEELNAAVELDSSDPWTRFGLAMASYHSGEKGARIQGLANMMESLHIVIDRNPEFAEAYNMLGWARLAGGGPNAALESMKVAVQLSPRNDEYQLRLARAYLAAKKFAEATATLDRLRLSQNPEIARAAKKDLNDLPFLEKYGVPPAEDTSAKQEAGVRAHRPESSQDPESLKSQDEDQDRGAANAKPSEPEIDKRPVKFLKATLAKVDCSETPMAIVTVSQGKRSLKLRAQDYKSVAVVGAAEFSCAWKNIPVDVNYRAGGKLDGDLVSIEIH